MSNAIGNYLQDLGVLLKEKALEARETASATRGTGDHQFSLGRVSAYHDVLSLMKLQATSFGIADEIIALSGFDPDHELLIGE